MNVPFVIKEEKNKCGEFDIDPNFIPQGEPLRAAGGSRGNIISLDDEKLLNGSVQMGFNINLNSKASIAMIDHRILNEKCKSIGENLGENKNLGSKTNQVVKVDIPFAINEEKETIREKSNKGKDLFNDNKSRLKKQAKVVESILEDFCVRDTGEVFKIKKDGCLEAISSYNIKFISCVERVEENTTNYFVKISAQNNSNSKPLILIVAFKDLGNVADIIRAKNPAFYVYFTNKNAAANFKQYVYQKYQIERASLKIEREYDCVGWVKNIEGKFIYVSHHLAECKSTNKRQLEIVKVDEVREVLAWGMDFISVGKRPENIVPLWIYSFYGFCIPLLQEAGFETQLILMIRGRSGSLKTAISKVLYSLFEIKHNNVNFQSTKAAVENALSDAKDNNFLWDDIYDVKHPSTKHFLEIVRCIADNIGRSRMNMKTRKKEQFNYRLGLVVTAENPIGEQMSGRLRYIVSTVEKNSFIGNKLDIYQRDAEEAFREGRGSKLEKYYSLFINFIQNNFELLKNELKMLMRNLERPFKERRLNASYQCFIAISFLATKFHLMHNDITYELFMEMLEASKKIILDLLAENEREASIVEDYKLWCKIISDGLASGEVNIAKNCEEYSKGGGNFLGYTFSNQELALEPNKTFLYVKKIAESRYSNAMVISKANIEKRLDEERIIRGYDEKNGDGVRRRHLIRVVIAELSSRFLMVDVEQFKKIVISLNEEI